MNDRPSPQAVEAEQALLGGLILDAEQLEDVARAVSADDFYRPDHARLFELLRQMRGEGKPIDLVSVAERVQRGDDDEAFGGLGYVLDLPDKVPSTANLGHYAHLVREKAALRRVIQAAATLVDDAHAGRYDPTALIDRASTTFTELAERDAQRDWERVSTIADREMVRIDTLSKDTSTVTGLTTGFRALDDKLAGLHPQNLVILAARPAMGKTALALNLAQNAAVMGERPVGLFSLEMGRGELVSRMLCCTALVDGSKVRTGTLDAADWERLEMASELMHEAMIFIDDTPGVTVDDIRARARRLKRAHPDLGLLVIDYLQLMQGRDPKANRQQQISEISRSLKMLAKELDTPVLALSQLNRGVEQRAEKRPMVSDLRESGAIEQDADVILFIYRDEVYNPESTQRGVAEVIIAKQRSGPTGTAKLAFQPQYTRFDNLAEDEFFG